MRRGVHVLALAIALLAAGCSDGPCQELGERLCACTGRSADECKAQVEAQLKSTDPGDSTCEAFLSTCNSDAAPSGDLCEWLLTEDGKQKCGLAPPPASP